MLPLLLAAGVAGCTFPNHRHDLRIFDDVATGGSGLSIALEQSTGVPMIPGHSVELVENGRIFDVLEEEIRRAQFSMNLATFIWRPSAPSDRIVQAVLERTRAGVRCRVLIDPLWSVKFDQVRRVLVEGGCDVREYRPIKANLGPRVMLRNHRRAVVIDGRVGITGGFGIWKAWEGDGLEPEEWRDSNVRVTGPVVRDLQLSFAENWQEVGGGLLPADEFPRPAETGEARAAFVTSDSNPGLSHAERMTLVLIAAAKERLWIANAYFIPSTAIADMLVLKAKAGVDVRILCPGPVHDVPPVRAAQRSTYEHLVRNGVRIWEYQPSMMHAKTMVIDDRVTVIGSTNLDPLSTKWLEEASLVVEDPALNAALAQSIERDLERSLEIRWSWWSKRGLAERLLVSLVPLIGIFL